jgi:addiction module HigA family antidote
MAKKTKLLDPIQPGEILMEEFLKPMGISINRLARDLDVPVNRMSLIVNGARGEEIQRRVRRRSAA